MTWPVALIAVIGIAGVVWIYQVGSPTDRSAVLAMLAPLCTAIATVYLARRQSRVEDKVDDVHREVNGNTKALLAKLPDPPPRPPAPNTGAKHTRRQGPRP